MEIQGGGVAPSHLTLFRKIEQKSGKMFEEVRKVSYKSCILTFLFNFFEKIKRQLSFSYCP